MNIWITHNQLLPAKTGRSFHLNSPKMQKNQLNNLPRFHSNPHHQLTHLGHTCLRLPPAISSVLPKKQPSVNSLHRGPSSHDGQLGETTYCPVNMNKWSSFTRKPPIQALEKWTGVPAISSLSVKQPAQLNVLHPGTTSHQDLMGEITCWPGITQKMATIHY